MGHSGVTQAVPSEASATVVISANAFWNISNFRAGLIDGLIGHGWTLVVAAPDIDQSWIARRTLIPAEIRVDRSGLNPLRDVGLLAAYVRLIRKHRPKYFLGFTAKPNIYGSLAAAICGTASIPNVSGLGTAFIAPGALSTLVGGLYRLAFARCPIVFFQNEDDRDLFVRRKIVRQDRARLLPGSGIDLDRFHPTQPNDAERIRFLFIGRLLGDKGIREFVEAARLLRPDYPDWRFQLLGPIDEGNRTGIRTGELDQWVRSGCVEYLGRADDVRPYIAAATAVVLPSYREGLPRSLLEAAAMARPLVATDVPGNRQIVEHGVNGLLCEPRNPESLAQAMLTMGEIDASARNAMGNAGRDIAERRFAEQRVVQAYLEAMAQLHHDARSYS